MHLVLYLLIAAATAKATSRVQGAESLCPTPGEEAILPLLPIILIPGFRKLTTWLGTRET